MRNRCRRLCCMNNNTIEDDRKDKCNNTMNIMENMCNNVYSASDDYNSNCSCGFDDNANYDVFPENPTLAQSYVPIQTMDETYKPCVGLKKGTIFPELVSPYMPGDSMKEIKYLERTNPIGEGCNKC